MAQGGLTTTMELTAAKVPFIYVPLRNHFEQNFHVRTRLERYNAGRYLDYADADPDTCRHVDRRGDRPLPHDARRSKPMAQRMPRR